MMRLFSLILLPLLLSACGEAVKDDHFANDMAPERIEPTPVQSERVPVRIGELGPNFHACAAAGTTRQLDAAAGDTLQVRAAPFDNSEEAGAIAAGTQFFICTRSHDQRWLGVVYHESGSLDAACGVSRPVQSRRTYDGPCRSGWVASAFVKQIAG